MPPLPLSAALPPRRAAESVACSRPAPSLTAPSHGPRPHPPARRWEVPEALRASRVPDLLREGRRAALRHRTRLPRPPPQLTRPPRGHGVLYHREASDSVRSAAVHRASPSCRLRRPGQSHTPNKPSEGRGPVRGRWEAQGREQKGKKKPQSWRPASRRTSQPGRMRSGVRGGTAEDLAASGERPGFLTG